jgi:hypothetical protein
MTFNFKPKNGAAQKLNIPFFEDVRADDVKGYTTRQSEQRLKEDIVGAIAKLGGGNAHFIEGEFGQPSASRYGYQIHFNFAGKDGLINIAALPLKTETEAKKRKALNHALYVVREMLTAQIAARIMTPGFEPLIQHLLVPGSGGKTVGEAILIRDDLPQLNPSQDIRTVNGEFVG